MEKVLRGPGLYSSWLRSCRRTSPPPGHQSGLPCVRCGAVSLYAHDRCHSPRLLGFLPMPLLLWLHDAVVSEIDLCPRKGDACLPSMAALRQRKGARRTSKRRARRRKWSSSASTSSWPTVASELGPRPSNSRRLGECAGRIVTIRLTRNAPALPVQRIKCRLVPHCFWMGISYPVPSRF